MYSEENHNDDLKNMPKENPFKVPEGYFDTLTERIEEKIYTQPETEKKNVVRFLSSVKNQIALAAGFALFVIISYAIMHYVMKGNTGEQVLNQQFADIIESEIGDYETSILIDAYIETQKEAIPNDIELPDEEMIEYLITEDIDIELIINEL